MAMQRLDCPFEWKGLGDTGEFSGYASVFGNIDQGGDIVERGAFKEMVKTRDGKTLILFQHRSDSPIGKADVKEDDHGLKVEGKLILEDPVARRAYTGMKAGTFDAMSFGFDVLPGGSEMTSAGIRRLKELKLWEVSVVTFGMNALARIDSVKAAGQITTIREYEDFLRDEAGFSHAQAKLLASGGWKSLQSARDGAGDAGVQTIIDRLMAVPGPKFN